MGLHSSIEDPQRADRTAAVLAVVGTVNVPIVHFSVVWWNSLHQAPTIMTLGGQKNMDPRMVGPLLLMLAGFTLLFIALLLTRLRAEVLRRERTASWIREAVGS
jgi:heme exporter protein C